MELLSANEAIKSIREYLNSDIVYPFFVSVDGSKEYNLIVSKFPSLKKIRISSFCNEDSYPNIDSFCDSVAHSAPEGTLILGIGEYISCGGSAVVLHRLNNMIIPHTVILCRGIKSEFRKLNLTDRKFNSRRYCIVESELDYSIIATDYYVGEHTCVGYDSLLNKLEEGVSGKVYVKTKLQVNPSHYVRSSYDAILEKDPLFKVPEDCLDSGLWDEFYKDSDLSNMYELFNWRTFLKYKISPPTDNAYLRAVVDGSDDYISYKRNLYDLILAFPPKSKEYLTYYLLRKELLKNESNMDINSYLVRTKQKGNDRIYYLTDNTDEEKYEIVKEIVNIGKIPEEVENIYTDLSDYLCKYDFTCNNSDVFTGYFDQYKHNKLLNIIDPAFLNMVEEYSVDGNRKYNGLSTRGSLVEKLDDGKSRLIWIDALGVEYLGFIQRKCKDLGLKIHVDIGRSVLPTITSQNRSFYDDWKGPKQYTKKLDDTKHKGEGLFNYERDGKLPIHLVAELDIISEVLVWAKKELLQENVSKVIIASDHGASRLVVINEHENQYKISDTDGEHSGRCCLKSKISERPESATAENGYWVLANYDRFQGGRRASVETHGGASLEEVVVPIISLSLVDSKITLENLTPIAWSSYDEDPIIEVFCASRVDSLKLRVNGVTYDSIKISDVKYQFVLKHHKTSGSYMAEVLDLDTIIGMINFDIQRRSGNTNRKIEDEFFV